MIFQEFYQSLYPILFYQWISLNRSTYKKDKIIFETSFSNSSTRILTFQMENVIGKITIWENGIVEEEIQENNGKQLFYLHYYLAELSYGCELFEEFYKILLNHNKQKIYQIALCCTGGLSSAVFADEIQQACQMSHLPIMILSLSLDDLKANKFPFDALYLAPQIAHLETRLLNHFHKPVYCIDFTDYATKNFHAILQNIKHNLKEEWS